MYIRNYLIVNTIDKVNNNKISGSDALKENYRIYLKAKDEKEGLAVSSKDLSDMLRLIDNRALTLEVLVQDLFYLTSIESGREELKLQRVPIGQFLEEYPLRSHKP